MPKSPTRFETEKSKQLRDDGQRELANYLPRYGEDKPRVGMHIDQVKKLEKKAK